MSNKQFESTAASTALVDDPWLKTPEACEYLRISVPTIRRWVKDGRLIPKRTPTGEFRFRRSSLDELLA